MSEMRKDRRAPASLKVKYKSATVDEFIEQFGTDISRGGIFIKTKKPLDAGALLKFAFQLQDGSAVIHGVGRVTWRRSEQNAKPDAPAGMGIKFIKLADESRAVVDRIAATRGPKGSRFEHTEGAELAPPMSSAPPPARDSVPPARPSSAPAPLSTSNAPRVAGPAPRTSGAPQSPAAARTGTGPQAGAAVRSSAAPQVGAAERTSTGPQVGAAVRSRAAPQVGAAARTSTGPRAAPVRSSEEPKPAVSGTTSAGLFAAPAGASAPRVAPPAPPETSGPSGANLFGDEPDLAASAPVGRASAPDSGPALPPRPAVASDKPADAAFKLPKGMVGSFFGEEAKTASMPKTTRDTSEFLASAFSAGGAGQDVRAEAHAQAEQARRDQGPADLADELFGDMPSQGDQSAELTPLGNPEDLAGLPRLSDPKVPSLAEVSLAEQIPSLEELTDESSDEVSGVGAGIEGADDDDEEMFGEADLGAASVRPLQPVSSARAPAAAQPSRAGLWVGLLVLLLAVGGGAYYFLVMRPSAAAPASAPQAAAEPPSAAEPEPVPAPAAAPSEPEPAAAQPTAAAEPAAAPPAAAVAEPAAPPVQEPPARPAPAAAARPAVAPAVVAVTAGPPADVNITSWPRAAEVVIDGKVSGVTPTTVSLPSVKPVDITVRMVGYASITRSVVPVAHMDPVRFKLEPLLYVLVVNTTPPGATVTLGTKSVVAPAPLDLGHLEGMVTVSIEKDGFQRTSRVVRLDEFQDKSGVMRADVVLNLSPLPQLDKPGAGKSHAKLAAPRPVAAPSAPVLSVTPAPKPVEKPVEKPAEKPAVPPPPKPAPAALPDNPF